jgi:hypothetical protein
VEEQQVGFRPKKVIDRFAPTCKHAMRIAGPSLPQAGCKRGWNRRMGYAWKSLKVNGKRFKKLSTENVNMSVDNWL